MSCERFLFFSERYLNHRGSLGRNRAKEEAYGRVCNREEKFAWLLGIRGTKRGARYEFCDIRLQGLFKSRRAPRFFPNANSSGSGATVLSEPVFSSGQRYGRHSLPVVYSELSWGELAARTERGSWCEIVLEGASPLFRSLASRRGASTMSKRQDCNERSGIFF